MVLHLSVHPSIWAYKWALIRCTILGNGNVLIFWTLVACQNGLDKQGRPKSYCCWRSSLIRAFPVCYSDNHFLSSSPEKTNNRMKGVRNFRTQYVGNNQWYLLGTSTDNWPDIGLFLTLKYQTDIHLRKNIPLLVCQLCLSPPKLLGWIQHMLHLQEHFFCSPTQTRGPGEESKATDAWAFVIVCHWLCDSSFI